MVVRRPLATLDLAVTMADPHTCWNCCQNFASNSNLRRHQRARKTPCAPGMAVPKRKVQDTITSQWRYRTTEEKRERERLRKREHYQQWT